jgi:hypothetical protein
MRKIILTLIACGLVQSHLAAQQNPTDARHQPLRDLNGYFPMQSPTNTAEWVFRREHVRRQILVSQGLWPLPQKTPLQATVHSQQEMDGYSMAKVYFQSMPGFYVTGSLYRPLQSQSSTGKFPAVLCPHGHWPQGRFYDAPASKIKEQLTTGAEKFSQGGRNPIQARCVHLARLGCVVFAYDMIGYADSQQISYDLAHRFAKQRPEMNHPTDWGFFSPQAESHLQNIMGLQTWNSIRSLDFLLTLPDVDQQRIAVTGASGGGTQTFILSAIDPRVRVSMPAVMVSTAMQGGCTCENACLLRVGQGNIEFAALFAPKPLGLTAANDWTVEMKTKGYPQLQQLFDMLGKPEHLHLEAHTNFPHNYNYVCRQAMYQWFNKHLQLGFAEVPPERDYKYQNAEQLTVFDREHPRPSGGVALEKKVLRHWEQQSQQQIDALISTRSNNTKRFQEIVGGGIDIVLGKSLPASEDVTYDQQQETQKTGYLQMDGILSNAKNGSANSILFLYPDNWNKQVVLWLTDHGRFGLLDESGNPKSDVQTLLNEGCCVVGLDMLFQAEWLNENESDAHRTRSVANPREAAAYTFGYNYSLFARRVHDILTAVSFITNHDMQPTSVYLLALDETGPLAIAARAQAGFAIDRLAANTNGFRFANVTDLRSPDFLPGGARYHDLPGMLAVAAPQAIWITGEKVIPLIVTQVYQVEKAADAVTINASSTVSQSAAITWLLDSK